MTPALFLGISLFGLAIAVTAVLIAAHGVEKRLPRWMDTEDAK